MTKTRNKPASYIAQMIADSERQSECYQEMLAIATKYGNEYEMERLPRQIEEMDNEVNFWMEEAIARGFGPDDLFGA